jgi:hypothetical protein
MLREGHPGTQKLKDVVISKKNKKSYKDPLSLSLSLSLSPSFYSLASICPLLKTERPNVTITARFVFTPPLEGGQIRFST